MKKVFEGRDSFDGNHYFLAIRKGRDMEMLKTNDIKSLSKEWEIAHNEMWRFARQNPGFEGQQIPILRYKN